MVMTAKIGVMDTKEELKKAFRIIDQDIPYYLPR
jgi:Ca2+-binding EF-hand superfamily protein